MTRTLMAAAMLEGAVLLLAVAYLVEHSPLSLVFALGLLAALAAHFCSLPRCTLAWATNATARSTAVVLRTASALAA